MASSSSTPPSSDNVSTDNITGGLTVPELLKELFQTQREVKALKSELDRAHKTIQNLERNYINLESVLKDFHQNFLAYSKGKMSDDLPIQLSTGPFHLSPDNIAELTDINDYKHVVLKAAAILNIDLGQYCLKKNTRKDAILMEEAMIKDILDVVTAVTSKFKRDKLRSVIGRQCSNQRKREEINPK